MLDTNGDWEDVLERLYAVYKADFIDSECSCQGFLVLRNRRILDRDCEETFWHLTTKDQYGDRLFDPRRSERLPWCRPIMTNCNDTRVATWKYAERKGKTRLYLWLIRLDYVIVLALRRDKLFLVTAYHVDGDSTRRNLNRKLRNREP